MRAPEGLESADDSLPRTFARATPALVLAPDRGAARELAAAIAALAGARLGLTGALATRGPAEDESELARRAVSALTEALAADDPCLLCALSSEVLRGLSARLLGIEPARSHALRVDPGRAVLLIDAPHGFLLRRSNVASPSPPAPVAPVAPVDRDQDARPDPMRGAG